MCNTPLGCHKQHFDLSVHSTLYQSSVHSVHQFLSALTHVNLFFLFETTKSGFLAEKQALSASVFCIMLKHRLKFDFAFTKQPVNKMLDMDQSILFPYYKEDLFYLIYIFICSCSCNKHEKFVKDISLPLNFRF